MYQLYNKLFLVIAFIVFSSSALAIDQVYKEEFVGDIAIKDVVTTGEDSQIIVQPYKALSLSPADINGQILPKQKNIYSKPILTISAKNIPVTEDMCLLIDASTCSELKEFGSKDICYNPCITGINSLAYDKKRKLLYFSAAPTNLGTGGGFYFIFVADLNNQKITYIKDELNPLNATLSPSGKYFVTYAYNSLGIYDTQTKKEFFLGEENSWAKGHEKLHYVGRIKWLSDTRFSYQDGVRHSKFQDSYDEMKENIYDILSKKIIQSRVMSKNEYNSKPYNDN